LHENNVFSGIDLANFDYGFKNAMLVAATEKRTKDEMDKFIELLANINLTE